MNKMQDLPLCDLNEVKRTAKRTDSDISGCKFSGEYLESEDLSCLSFINCMFENCEAVSDTFRELRNAVFSADQAVELSMLLGIRIK